MNVGTLTTSSSSARLLLYHSPYLLLLVGLLFLSCSRQLRNAWTTTFYPPLLWWLGVLLLSTTSQSLICRMSALSLWDSVGNLAQVCLHLLVNTHIHASLAYTTHMQSHIHLFKQFTYTFSLIHFREIYFTEKLSLCVWSWNKAYTWCWYCSCCHCKQGILNNYPAWSVTIVTLLILIEVRPALTINVYTFSTKFITVDFVFCKHFL